MLLQHTLYHVSTIWLTFDSGRETAVLFAQTNISTVKSIRLRDSGHTTFQAVGKYDIHKMNIA